MTAHPFQTSARITSFSPSTGTSNALTYCLGIGFVFA